MLPQIFIFTNRMIRRDYGFRRGEAELITRQLKAHQKPGEKVTVIHQATHGLTYFMLRYCAFPDVVIYPWSIGGKQYDTDVWSVPKSADEFKSDLLETGGILYLHEINEFFRKRYSQLFADASAVGSGRFYRMGSDGKLRELENATLPLIIDNFNFFLPAGNKWRAISFDGKTIKCRVNDKLVLDLQDTKLLYSAVYRKVKIAGHTRNRGLHLTFCGKNGVKNGVSLPGDGDFEVTFNLPDKSLGGVSLELTAAAEPGEISLNQVTLGR